jgi:hypothetical protein
MVIHLCSKQTEIVVPFCRNIFDGYDLSVILFIEIREHNYICLFFELDFGSVSNK